MSWGFFAALVGFGLVVFLIVALMRRSGQHAAAEEREAFERRQKEAIIADQERADVKKEAAQAADRVPVDHVDPATAILRRAGRLRKTGD